MANIFLDNELVGTTNQSNLFSFIPTGSHEIIFQSKGKYDMKLSYSREPGHTLVYPEMTSKLPIAVSIIGGLVVGLFAFGLGRAMKK